MWLGEILVRSVRGASDQTGRSECEPVSPEIRALLETDGRISWESRAVRTSAKANVGVEKLEEYDFDLPGDIGGGMPGRNVQ